MRDSDIVALIVAGDPEGLAAAFDRYATPLFAYCSAQLRDSADAAAVVRDTFRVAASRLDGLREPEHLRSWLYAVARVQCLSLIENGEARSAVGVPPEEPAELPALLRAALGGLGQGERDVVLLTLWQGLGTVETATVLGISRLRVQSLLTRARGQLGRSLGALFVARTGRRGCDAVDGLLTGWDGQLTAAVRRRLSRHIRRCRVCTDRRRRELELALLGRAPGTALTGVLTEAYGAANIPPWLADAALSAGAAPSHPGRFRKDGFPEPAARPQPWLRSATLVPAVAVAVVVVALTVVVVALDAGSHGGNSAAGAQAGRDIPSAPDLYTPGGGGGGGGGRTPGSTPGGPGPSRSAPGTRHTAGVIAVTTTTVHPTSGTGSTSGTGTRVPSVPSDSATAAPTTAPSASASAAASPTPAPGASSTSVSQGTLSVSPTTVALTLSDTGTITLTAENGPVSWSISGPSSLLGELTVAPASGTLAAGQSTQVTITVTGLASLDADLTVSPGSEQVTVLLGVGL